MWNPERRSLRRSIESIRPSRKSEQPERVPHTLPGDREIEFDSQQTEDRNGRLEGPPGSQELSDAAWHGVEFNSQGGCLCAVGRTGVFAAGGSQPPTLLPNPSALGITIGWEAWGTLPDQRGGDLTGQADIGGIRFPTSRRGPTIAVGFQPTGSPCTGIGNTAAEHWPKAAGNTPGERPTTRHLETERFPCRQENLCLPRTRRAFCGEGRAAVVPRSRGESFPGTTG
jgi:hypothetical protein